MDWMECVWSLSPLLEPGDEFGDYALLQPALAMPLRENRLSALEAGNPELIATANIGCLAHLQAGCRLPVQHWIEVVDEAGR